MLFGWHSLQRSLQFHLVQLTKITAIPAQRMMGNAKIDNAHELF